MSKTKEPKEGKQFSLKDIEMRMIQAMQGRHQAETGNFMSFIALERLNYQVTENTQFRLEGNTLTITEVEPEKKEEVAVS